MKSLDMKWKMNKKCVMIKQNTKMHYAFFREIVDWIHFGEFFFGTQSAKYGKFRLTWRIFRENNWLCYFWNRLLDFTEFLQKYRGRENAFLQARPKFTHIPHVLIFREMKTKLSRKRMHCNEEVESSLKVP